MELFVILLGHQDVLINLSVSGFGWSNFQKTVAVNKKIFELLATDKFSKEQIKTLLCSKNNGEGHILRNTLVLEASLDLLYNTFNNTEICDLLNATQALRGFVKISEGTSYFSQSDGYYGGSPASYVYSVNFVTPLLEKLLVRNPSVENTEKLLSLRGIDNQSPFQSSVVVKEMSALKNVSPENLSLIRSRTNADDPKHKAAIILLAIGKDAFERIKILTMTGATRHQ
jgi:hypothetical protein